MVSRRKFVGNNFVTVKSIITKTIKKESFMEIVLSAINVGATCAAAILSYLSFRSTEMAQRQNVNAQLLGKRLNVFSLLKTWCDKANTAFEGNKGGYFDLISAFRPELLSTLENPELSFYSEELKKYDDLLKKTEDPKQKDEIRNKQRDIYSSKLLSILVSVRKAQREIVFAKHIFSLADTDVSKIEFFTETYRVVAEKIINYDIRDYVPEGEEKRKIDNDFEMLRNAYNALREAKILEYMSDQLNELRDLFGG